MRRAKISRLILVFTLLITAASTSWCEITETNLNGEVIPEDKKVILVGLSSTYLSSAATMESRTRMLAKLIKDQYPRRSVRIFEHTSVDSLDGVLKEGEYISHSFFLSAMTTYAEVEPQGTRLSLHSDFGSIYLPSKLGGMNDASEYISQISYASGWAPIRGRFLKGAKLMFMDPLYKRGPRRDDRVAAKLLSAALGISDGQFIFANRGAMSPELLLKVATMLAAIFGTHAAVDYGLGLLSYYELLASLVQMSISERGVLDAIAVYTAVVFGYEISDRVPTKATVVDIENGKFSIRSQWEPLARSTFLGEDIGICARAMAMLKK